MLAALLANARRSLLPALFIAALLLGMLRWELSGGDRSQTLVPYHSRSPVQVEGVVVSDPEAAGSATRLRLRVDRIGSGDGSATVTGDVLVTLRESVELARARGRPYFRYGDRLSLEGALKAPEAFEGFDYPAYLARQGIGSVMLFPDATLVEENQGAAFYRWLYGVRRRIADSLDRAVPEPQAALGHRHSFLGCATTSPTI